MEEPKIRLEVLIDIRPQKIVVFDPPITATPWHLKLILEKYYWVPRERFLLSVQPNGTNQWIELDGNELQATWAEIFTTYGGGTERKLFLVTHSIPSIHELPRDRERLLYIIFEDHSDRPRMFIRIQSFSRETVAELKRKIMKETSGEVDFITRRIEYNDTLADIHCTDLEDNRTLASYALKDGCSLTVKIKLGKDEMEVRIKVLPNLQEVTKNYKLLQKKSPLRLIMRRSSTLLELKERLRAVEPLIAHDDRVFFFQYSLELTDDVRLDALKSDLNTDELNLDLIVRRPLNEGVFQLLVMSVFGEKQVGVQQRQKGLEGHVRAQMEEAAVLSAQPQHEEGFFSRAIKSVFGSSGGGNQQQQQQNSQSLLRDVPLPNSDAPPTEPRNEMELRQLILSQQMEKQQLQRQIEELQQQQLRLQMVQQSRARAATAPAPLAKQPQPPGKDHHGHDGHDHHDHDGHDHSHPHPHPHRHPVPAKPAAAKQAASRTEQPITEPIDPRLTKPSKPARDLPFGPADLPPGMDMATAEQIYREQLRRRDEERRAMQQTKKLRSPHSPPYPPPGYVPPPTSHNKPKKDDWAAEMANSLTALEEPRRGRRPTTREERPAHGELWANRTADVVGSAATPQAPSTTTTSPRTQQGTASPLHNSQKQASTDHPPTSPSPHSQTALLVKTPKHSPAPLQQQQFIRQGASGGPPRQLDPAVLQQMQMQMQLLQLQLQAMQQPGAVQLMDPRILQQQLHMLQQQMAAYMQTGQLPGTGANKTQPPPPLAKPAGGAALRAGSRGSIDPRVAAMMSQRGFDPSAVEAMENALLSSAPGTRRPTNGGGTPPTQLAQQSRPAIGKPASLSLAETDATPAAAPVSPSHTVAAAPAASSTTPASSLVATAASSVQSNSTPVPSSIPESPEQATPAAPAASGVPPTQPAATDAPPTQSATTERLDSPTAAVDSSAVPAAASPAGLAPETTAPSPSPVVAAGGVTVAAPAAISPVSSDAAVKVNGTATGHASDHIALVAPTTLGTDFGFPGSGDTDDDEDDDDDEDEEDEDEPDEQDKKQPLAAADGVNGVAAAPADPANGQPPIAAKTAVAAAPAPEATPGNGTHEHTRRLST